MTYQAEYDLIMDESNDLHKKVARAIDVTARAVISEDPGTTNHANRLVWATHIRKDTAHLDVETQRWITQVLDNATVSAAGNLATDSDVQFVVNGLTNTMADAHVGA